MATQLDQARRLITKRLEEIDEERDQLRAALDQLDRVIEGKSAGHAASRAANVRGRRRRKGRATSSGRAARGQREEQLITSIANHPDFRVADHAREIGVKPQQLYPILKRLLGRQAIAKKDDKYVLAEPVQA